MKKISGFLLISILFISCTNDPANAPVQEIVTVPVDNGPTSVPNAPLNLRFENFDNGAWFYWDDSATATSYNIYMSSNPGVTKTNGTQIANVTSGYLDRNVRNWLVFYFVVTAVNSAGESIESNEVRVKSGTVDNFNGTVWNQILNQTWTKCNMSDIAGRTSFDNVTKQCDITRNGYFSFCNMNDRSCSDGAFLNGSGYSEVYIACQAMNGPLSPDGKTGWRVPTFNEYMAFTTVIWENKAFIFQATDGSESYWTADDGFMMARTIYPYQTGGYERLPLTRTAKFPLLCVHNGR